MELESRKVFIDTQSFIKMGLNIHHPALERLRKLASERLIQYYITTVVEREVRSHIDVAITEALTAVKNFQRKARLLQRLEEPEIVPLFVDLESDDIKAKAQSVFSAFLDGCDSTCVDANGVAAEDIISSYFDRSPPFGDGKKKSEFPDAFSLNSLLSAVGDEKIYIISEDGDHKSFCEIHDQFLQLDTLDQFLDIYSRHESALADLVVERLVGGLEQIEAELKEMIEGLGVYNSAPWEDSEVVDFEVGEITSFSPSVIYVDDEEAIVTLDFEVAYSVTVTGPDLLNGIYDSEEKRMLSFRDTTRAVEGTQEMACEFYVSYEANDGQLDNFNIDGPRLINTQDIEVYVSEYEDQWD